MSILDRIDKYEIRDFLGRGWLTHDGIWFYNTYKELGIEMANKLNLAAISMLAPIELQSAKKLFGMEKKNIGTFNELARFLHNCLELILPASISNRISFTAASDNIIKWEWVQGECFAYKGMKRIGLIEEYKCGVMFRIECWLQALNIKYEITPKIDKCVMHATGVCSGEIKVSMDNIY